MKMKTLNDLQAYGYSAIRLDSTPYDEVMGILDELDDELEMPDSYHTKVDLIRGRGLLSKRLRMECVTQLTTT